MDHETYDWTVLADFFKKYGFVHHQIESFDDFVYHGIERAMTEEPGIVVPLKDREGEHRITFNDVYIPKPTVLEEDRNLRTIFPSEARTRDLTYDSPIYVTVTETIAEEGKKPIHSTHRRVVIGRIPIMLKSGKCSLSGLSPDEIVRAGECHKDPGGYFIVKGKERVIISQIRGTYNVPMVFSQKPKNGEKFEYVCEVRSMSEETGHSVLVQCMIGLDKRTLVFSLPYIKNPIPIGVIFKALGYITDEQISDLVGLKTESMQPYMDLILRDSFFVDSQERALDHIGAHAKNPLNKAERAKYAWQVLEGELFPHMGVCSTIKEKAYFVGHMVHKLMSTHLKMREPDDRDNYVNKRIEPTGVLCFDLFRTLYKNYIDSIAQVLADRKQRPDILSVMARHNIITSGFRHCYATGKWGAQKNSYTRAGVSQVLCRLTYGATLSHLRRATIPIGKEGKNAKMRQIHPSQAMFLCPTETPEGAAVGIVLNFSLLTKMSRRVPTVQIKHVVETMESITLLNDFIGDNDQTKIFVNGTFMGMTDDSYTFVDEFKDLRDSKLIHRDVSVGYDDIDDEIHIFSDEGRMTRPVYKVQDEKIVACPSEGTNWDDLVEKGHIVYVDNMEVNTAVVAFYRKELVKYRNDYCEISPAMMFGVMASTIPFPDHSQCIHINEPVMMADGTRKEIQYVNVGDEVITFDPKTHEQTFAKVSHTYTNHTDKQLLEVKTLSGRKIKATFDHRFMTMDGWTRLEHTGVTDMSSPNPNTMLAVSLEQIPVSISSEHTQEISAENVRTECLSAGVNPLYVEKYCNYDLSHILPLTGTDNCLPVIARIYGFTIADGWVGVSEKGVIRLGVDFSTKYGSELFSRDAMSLGFPAKTARYTEKEGYGNTYRLEYSGCFPALLVGIGRYTGKRNSSPYPPVPAWIINGSDMVKREFLAGFQGADGSKIKNGNSKQISIQIGATSKFVNKEHTSEALLFMTQVTKLFEDLGVEVSQPTTKPKNGLVEISYNISCKRLNIIKYFDLVGYRYDVHKITSSGVLVEFLRYIEESHQERILLVKYVSDMRVSGVEPKQISLDTGIDVKEIYNILKLTGKTTGISKTHIPLSTWIDTVKCSSTTIFVPIRSMTNVDDCMISDITIESDNQSFLCGDMFGVHNSPRNVYQSAMGKQAMGMFCTAYNIRTDTVVHVLDYPQKPLVTTKAATMMGFDDMPSGINAIVAVLAYTGFNQEDSVLVKKSAIERGMFTATTYRNFTDCEKKQGTHSYEKIVLTGLDIRRKNLNYGLLDSQGIVKRGVYVDKNDVIISKCLIESNKSGDEEVTDCSMHIKKGEEGYVDRRVISITPDGYKLVKVIIRTSRIPEVGDKFATRSAQKGTCGAIIQEEDMPFNCDGITPDIIINAHAFPSRMTVNQLLECVLSKTGATTGKFGDATPFTSSSIAEEIDGVEVPAVDKICEALRACGHQPEGLEVLCNGMTGDPLNAMVFMGPTYYQRLKHLVSDKMHARAYGPVTTLTKQPLEGRSRDGGLRFGEMERDAMISQGNSEMLKERLFTQSDYYKLAICNECGNIATTRTECKPCQTDDVSIVNFPYVAKLLCQELNAMVIRTRIEAKK